MKLCTQRRFRADRDGPRHVTDRHCLRRWHVDEQPPVTEFLFRIQQGPVHVVAHVGSGGEAHRTGDVRGLHRVNQGMDGQPGHAGRRGAHVDGFAEAGLAGVIRDAGVTVIDGDQLGRDGS